MLLQCLVLVAGVVASSKIDTTAQLKQSCVVVTGCSGWVGGHVADQLLARGYEVHCTVRDATDMAKVGFLYDIEKEHEGKGGRLALFQADLLADKPFESAAAGCLGFIHVASPVVGGGATDDPDALIQPAIKGTLAALQAATDAGAEVFVMTSSTASVAPSKAKYQGCKGDAECAPYTEGDYNDVATETYGTYAYSKVRAEEEAYKLAEQLGAEAPRVTSIHFSMAVGPQQNSRVTSSQVLVEFLMKGGTPFVLPLSPQITDVRDVARAHVHVMEHSEAEGRYIVAVDPEKSGYTYKKIAAVLAKAYPTYPVPAVEAPMWVLYLLGYLGIDKKLDIWMVDAAARSADGKIDGRGIAGTHITETLGFTYVHEDLDSSIRDAAASMVKFTIVDGTRVMKPAVKVVGGIFAVITLAIWYFVQRTLFTYADADQPGNDGGSGNMAVGSNGGGGGGGGGGGDAKPKKSKRKKKSKVEKVE